MPGSLEKLTNAVLYLDKELAGLHSRANKDAGDLVALGDMLAREVENDLDIIVMNLKQDITGMLNEKIEEIKQEYTKKKEEQLRLVKGSAEINMDKAVEAVASEIKKLLTEV